MNSVPDCELKALTKQLWGIYKTLAIYTEFLSKEKVEIKPDNCITSFKQVWTCQTISKLVQIVITQWNQTSIAPIF